MRDLVRKFSIVICLVVIGFAAVFYILEFMRPSPKTAQSPQKPQHYQMVNNQDYSRGDYQYIPVYKQGDNFPNALHTIRGNGHSDFITQYFLPTYTSRYSRMNDENHRLMRNPQSVVLHGQYAYVMYTFYGGSNTGFVVRYDLKKLQQLGFNLPGYMSKFRHSKTQLDGIKIGPIFKTGHGQSLAYNPKNKQMWFVKQNGFKPVVQRFDMDTLKPMQEVKVKINSSGPVPMGMVLAFDKRGNAYFYSITHHGIAPRGSVKIYRGQISDKDAQFKLIPQVIRHAPGIVPQSLAYNAQNNNLYLVSNGGIMRLPVSKLGHLKKSDVRTIITDGHREFEGLSFEDGKGMLLVNRGPELMRMTNPNF
ncbi:hypothetical protein [Fructilactobacillus fructivorans]|uniref:Extracellular protein n=2 Tax=Fructilactobacillus fructivorans TaxID=1614 RepID=A0AAE6P3N3_9LACO|nr:hypothetical protein [Fructilactobacillus fructivorans]KRK56915.1 hypothetical protein FC73_GL001309 [Fructilactobacillus fructivorans]QFX93233.1 hypothetical protein LF543_06640 [Fructilactobacillus fructivorans]RDV65053.1 hypothetical protein DXU76_03430 [Fructilactobacillus fructivorans]